MRTLIKAVLARLARATIARYHPRVVGVTGSVGKTSAKEAVAAVLGKRWRVGSSPKNLNNEIGLPLAILGEYDSGYRSLWRWAGIVARSLWQLVVRSPHYPEVVVLEYGIDHRGDMDYLLALARPEVAVVTAVSATHLEFLGTVEAVAAEKGKLVAGLAPGGTAVLNADDALVAAMRSRAPGRVVTFGPLSEADVRAESVAVSRGDDGAARGMSFKLASGGSSVPVLLPGIIGLPPVMAALAGAAVGLCFGMTALEVGEALRSLVFPPGRLRLLPGVKGTLLIDDSYNSSPRAAAEALAALHDVPVQAGARRWAVLGDMLELGEASDTLHREVGELVTALQLDFLVTVGERSRALANGAVSSGFPVNQVVRFATAAEAGLFIQAKLQRGDVVLVKGSQGVRCEKVTKELMAEPERAAELLVRQYKPWV